jgi:PAS domain S-box-containing protein
MKSRAPLAVPDRDGEFKSIVENSPDIVARVSPAGQHLYVNRAAEVAFHIRPDDVIGRTYRELNFPEAAALAYEVAIGQVVASREQRTFDFSVQNENRTRHFTARAIPEGDIAGEVTSVLIVTYDVTQRTEAQLERDALLIREQASRMQAEAAARARDEFLAIVSHELRSPLNGIQSWAHVLEAYVPMDQPMVVRALTGIKIGVHQQVRLIDDLLDATLIMSSKLKLSKAAVELAACVDAAVASLAELAEEKRITLKKHLPDAPILIHADGKRLEQVIWNLLSNAIKFSAEDSQVDVELEVVGDEARIGVRDNGRGIAAAFLPFLFDPFRQADESITRRAGGIGLGLTLVRRLTELHGGRVAVESGGENHGAYFSVHLPLDPDIALRGQERTVKRQGQKTLESLSGRRVALVDDLKEARDSLAHLLGQAGADVMTFSSGREVVEFLESSPEARPDVLVCDIAMPDQDGYLTLQQIRALERARDLATLPAIALTAFSQHQDESKALASGFQVHLAKPVDPAELSSIIAAVTAGLSRGVER